MIDILTLALTHGLMACAAIAMLSRAELDEEGAGKPAQRWRRRRPETPPKGTQSADRD
jgi:hypothetical protein